MTKQTRKPLPPVLTIGHSARSLEDFLELLHAHGVKRLIDVCKLPGSNTHPHFNQEVLSAALKEAGIGYLHVPALGGRRRPRPDSPNGGWHNRSFQGYADYMQTDEFEMGLQAVIATARRHRIALMCAEAVPWRCHRSLIADALTARHSGRAHPESDPPPAAHAAIVCPCPGRPHHLSAGGGLIVCACDCFQSLPDLVRFGTGQLLNNSAITQQDEIGPELDAEGSAQRPALAVLDLDVVHLRKRLQQRFQRPLDCLAVAARACAELQ